jgi:hypothetical protein
MFPTFHYSVHAPSGISFNNSGMYTQGPDIRNQYSILAWFTVLVSSDMLAGQYSVVVTYNFYSGPVPILTNLLTFNVTVPFQAPVIIQQPQNLTNEYGSAAAFRVKATGEPLMYQWRFNGSNLEGATNLSYAIPSVNTNHSGLYSVVVSNVLGSVISSDAMLVVIINPPVITQQPQSLTNQYGGAATFSVKTTGTEPLTYQWLFNGADLIGATNISYTIHSVQTNNSGLYSVMVSNYVGSVLSSKAELVVIILHFEQVTKTGNNYQTTVKGMLNDAIVIEISTNMLYWTPILTNIIGIEEFVVPIVADQNQIYFRARSYIPAGMVWIQPGTFTMGSPTNEVGRFLEEGPQTQVTISRGFWMSKYATTQEEYLTVMGNNPSHFTGDLKRPVEQVRRR